MGTIKNLDELLRKMEPVLSPNTYYICTVDKVDQSLLKKSLLYFVEKEGATVVVDEKYVDQVKGKKSDPHALITLNVYSDLEAVGFLAALLPPLAKEGISVNVISAYYHDHLFVPKEKAKKAVEILQNISKASL